MTIFIIVQIDKILHDWVRIEELQTFMPTIEELLNIHTEELSTFMPNYKLKVLMIDFFMKLVNFLAKFRKQWC